MGMSLNKKGTLISGHSLQHVFSILFLYSFKHGAETDPVKLVN